MFRFLFASKISIFILTMNAPLLGMVFSAIDSHICRYNIVVCHKSLYEPCFIQQNKWKPAKQALAFKLLLNTMEFKMLNKCILKKENIKACS